MWDNFTQTLKEKQKEKCVNTTLLAKEIGVDKVYLYKAIKDNHFSQKMMEKIANYLDMAVVFYGNQYFLVNGNEKGE